jgi:hypothetical protein
MEKKIICSDNECAQAHIDFCDTMMMAINLLGNNAMSPEEYATIHAYADNEYNNVIYGEY